MGRTMMDEVRDVLAFCVVGAVALAGLWVLYTVLFSLGLGCIGDAAGCAMK